MTRIPLTIPELAVIGGTRAALGAGLGLLMADRLSHEQRRAVGWTLLAVGVISTLPIAAELFAARREMGPRSGGGMARGVRVRRAREGQPA